jgi:hypothetical protein
MTYLGRYIRQGITTRGVGVEGVKWSHLALDKDKGWALVKRFELSSSI